MIDRREKKGARAEKKEPAKKLEDFRTDRDTMDEVFENREQIEISKYYEKLPKPDLIAISEFEDGELYYRMAGTSGEDGFSVEPARKDYSDADAE